jgi:CheY-like chemotaxis protein
LIFINIDIPDNLWNVNIDKDQIIQVITNIIINAKQAMSNRGKIFIKAENSDINFDPYKKPGRYLKISIKDDGCGISQENLNKIFDPYFTTKENGSGLGLAICYSILKKHNGYIDIQTKVNDGATFIIFLPALTEKIKEKANIEKSIIYGTGKVLIIDDDICVIKTIEKMLTFLHFEYDSVKKGEDGVVLYKKSLKEKRPYDVIITDLTIPGGIGGVDIIKKLKNLNPDVKCIVSSGYSNNPIMSNYKKYGFCEVMNKPYTVEELSRILNKVINF